MTRLIAYMTTPGGLTGAPRRLLTLASVLKKEGIEVCIASQSGSELLEAAEAEGHETAALDSAGLLALRQGALFGGGAAFRIRVLFDLLRQNWRLFRCIRSRQGDVVWIRGSKGIAFGALGALLSRRPLIWDVDYELPSRGMVRWLHRLGLSASKAVILQYSAAPEAIFGQRLAMRYSRKFRTIIPGIALESLEPFRMMRAERNKSHAKSFVILQVGTICDRKNQRLTLAAIGQALGNGNGWQLWLVYDEIQDAGIHHDVANKGFSDKVKFLGWRNDVHNLMERADILVMPSLDEGIPNAVQEAMAIGLPVLVSAQGGMPEIVQNDVTGWIIGVDDLANWAERMTWCYENRRELRRIGKAASAYALQSFDTAAWGEQYAEVVRSASLSSRQETVT